MGGLLLVGQCQSALRRGAARWGRQNRRPGSKSGDGVLRSTTRRSPRRGCCSGGWETGTTSSSPWPAGRRPRRRGRLTCKASWSCDAPLASPASNACWGRTASTPSRIKGRTRRTSSTARRRGTSSSSTERLRAEGRPRPRKSSASPSVSEAGTPRRRSCRRTPNWPRSSWTRGRGTP